MKIVYIDAQNIHKWVQEYWRIIDWYKFFVYLREKYKADKVKIFFGYRPEYIKLYEFLQKTWYEKIFKKITVLPNGDIKWNVDIDIAIHSINDYRDGVMSSMILVSSDWDYNSLVEYFHKKWIFEKLIITSFQKTSKLFSSIINFDKMLDLQSIKNKIYKKP